MQSPLGGPREHHYCLLNWLTALNQRKMIHGYDAGGQGCQSCVMGATLALPAAPTLKLMLIFTCTQAWSALAETCNDCILMAALHCKWRNRNYRFGPFVQFFKQQAHSLLTRPLYDHLTLRSFSILSTKFCILWPCTRQLAHTVNLLLSIGCFDWAPDSPN